MQLGIKLGWKYMTPSGTIIQVTEIGDDWVEGVVIFSSNRGFVGQTDIFRKVSLIEVIQ